MKNYIIFTAAAATIAVTAANANAGLIINDFSTSFSDATDISDTSGANVGSFTPNINQIATRFFEAADGGNVDLLVKINFPNANPNTDGSGRKVGLAGAGLNFANYSQGSVRDPYKIDYTFVDSGTNNPVTIDELSFGLKDLDENRGSIGEENILFDAGAFGAIEIRAPGGVNVVNGALQDIGGKYADLGLTNGDPLDFKLDPDTNNNNAVINFTNVTDTFSLIFSNEAGGSGLNGGFNVVGGNKIDTGGFTSTSVASVPIPATLPLLGAGLALIGIAAGRRRRATA